MTIHETILARVKVRLKGDVEVSDELLKELICTAVDRITLRVGADEMPPPLSSIAVEVCVKMYRRMYYEGIKEEGADTIKTSFADDILLEYESELSAYKAKISALANKSIARFL